jgi:hypothetical protein
LELYAQHELRVSRAETRLRNPRIMTERSESRTETTQLGTSGTSQYTVHGDNNNDDDDDYSVNAYLSHTRARRDAKAADRASCRHAGEAWMAEYGNAGQKCHSLLGVHLDHTRWPEKRLSIGDTQEPIFPMAASGMQPSCPSCSHRALHRVTRRCHPSRLRLLLILLLLLLPPPSSQLLGGATLMARELVR